MKNSNLKKELNHHYRSISLSPDRLARLRSAQAMTQPRPPSWTKPTLIASIAACLIVAFAFLFQTKPIEDRIFAEVAYNHRKNMPSEVLSSDFSTINQALDRLDFVAKFPALLAKNYVVQGARYCSIQGKIAIQIQLQEKDSKERLTLYQYGGLDTPEVHAQRISGQNDGLEFLMWSESGNHYVLTGSEITAD